MRIVIDTNVIVRDFRGLGHDFMQLRNTVELGQHKVYIPEVVLIEVRAVYLREIDRAKTELGKLSSKVQRLIGYPVEDPLSEALGEAERSADEYINDLLSSLSAHRLSDPNVGHADLVDRAARRRRPFREKGTGYRDALIWATVVELAEDEEVALISENTADFGDDDGDLHPDLKDDLRRAHAQEVLLVPSLRKLFEAEPPLESSEIRPDRLPSPTEKTPDARLLDFLIDFDEVLPTTDLLGLEPDEKVLEIANALAVEGQTRVPDWFSYADLQAEAMGLPPGTTIERFPHDFPFRMSSVWLGIPRQVADGSIYADFEVAGFVFMKATLPTQAIQLHYP